MLEGSCKQRIFVALSEPTSIELDPPTNSTWPREAGVRTAVTGGEVWVPAAVCFTASTHVFSGPQRQTLNSDLGQCANTRRRC